MSDIKNENDDLKDFPNYNKNHFDQIFPGIRERDEKIASLLTTIESQKEEIASHGPEGRNYTNQQYVELLQKFESLKAITELAVNALKEELQAAKLWDMDGTVRNIQAVLSEIERLSHELDK